MKHLLNFAIKLDCKIIEIYIKVYPFNIININKHGNMITISFKEIKRNG